MGFFDSYALSEQAVRRTADAVRWIRQKVRELDTRLRRVERTRYQTAEFLAVTVDDFPAATLEEVNNLKPSSGRVVPYVWHPSRARYEFGVTGGGTEIISDVHGITFETILKQRVVWVLQETRTNRLQIQQQLCDSAIPFTAPLLSDPGGDPYVTDPGGDPYVLTYLE